MKYCDYYIYVTNVKLKILLIANIIMFIFVIIVAEKFMIIQNSAYNNYFRPGNIYGNKKQEEQTPLTQKQKRIILASSAMGVAPVLAVLAARKGFSLNPARIIKTPVKDWAIFKYAPKDKSIQFETAENMAIASGSVLGGFIGGAIADDKSNLKAKKREILNQLLGNAIVPIACVGGGAAFYAKHQDKIEGFMPQIKNKSGNTILDKVFKNNSKQVVSVLNKILKKIPNVAGTFGFLGIGVYIGNRVSNFINNKIYHKKVDRKIKVSDFAPHVDDLCLAASMMNKESCFGSVIGRIIPLALLVPGYQTGIAREKK